jgi:hypothetical protein
MAPKSNRKRNNKKNQEIIDEALRPTADTMKDVPKQKYKPQQPTESFNAYRSEIVTIHDMKRADSDITIHDPTDNIIKEIFDGLRVGTTAGVDSIYDPAYANVYRKLILVTKPIPDYLLCAGLQSYISKIAKITSILKPIDNISSLTETSSEAVYRCIARSVESVMHSKNNPSHAWNAFKRRLLPAMIILKQSWATGMTIADIENHLERGTGPKIALIQDLDEKHIEEMIIRRGTSSGIYIFKKQKDHWHSATLKQLQFYVNIINPDNVTKIIETGFVSTIAQRFQTIPTFVKEHVTKIVYPPSIANKIEPFTKLAHNYNHYAVTSKTLKLYVSTFETLDSTLLNTEIVSDLEKETLLNWMNRGKVIANLGEPTPTAVRNASKLVIRLSNSSIADAFSIQKVTNLRAIIQERQQLVIFAPKSTGKSSFIRRLNHDIVTVIDSDDYGNSDTYNLESQLSALLICSSLYDIHPAAIQQALGRLIAGTTVTLGSLLSNLPDFRVFKRLILKLTSTMVMDQK